MAGRYAPHLRPSHDQNPFDSPGLSMNSVEDTESGNTSGQDEFHLERYSEGLRWDENSRPSGPQKPARQPSRRAREPSPRKRPRPGLNIITDFSKPVGRAFTDGAVLDQVKTQRPKVGQRPMLTARSQTVEHVRPEHHLPPSEGTGFVNLNDIVDLRKKEKKEKSPPKASKRSKVPGLFSNTKEKPAPAYSVRDPYQNVSARQIGSNGSNRKQDEEAPSRYLYRPTQEEASPSNSSIVIGISVPENDVDSHKPQPEASSALTMHTPFTPTIVVTPADATSWNKSLDAHDGARWRRPASSVYSQATPYVSQFSTSTDAPAVPALPQGFEKDKQHADSTSPRRSVDSWETVAARRRRAYSAGTIFDEDENVSSTRPRSSSAESKVAILPSSVDTARPQSKGWWNIMLSPMLSRAGTVMSRRSPPMKHPIPPMPALSADPGKPDKASDLDGKSIPISGSKDLKPDVGFNINRASTWSQWSNWEREREQSKDQPKVAEMAEVDSNRGHKVQDSSATVQFMMKPSPVAEGLAAEYYHACAVDLRSAGPYFECQNHSCAEKLPKLASVSGATEGRIHVETINPFEDRGLEHRSMSTSPRDTNDRHLRSDSDSTIIEDEPAVVSPVVRKAEVAPLSKAQQITAPGPASTNGSGEEYTAVLKSEAGPQSNKSVTPPRYSPPRPGFTRFPRHFVAVTPDSQLPPVSPGPMSPEMQRAMASQGAIPMAEVQQAPPAPPAPTFINNYTIYPDLPSRPAIAPVSFADIGRPSKVQEKAEAKRRNLEKEDAVAQKAGGLWRGRGCVPKNGCFGRSGPEGRKRRRWYIVIAVALFLVVVASVVLATQLTRKGDETPVQSQWLNLTGFPPMPTGLSTIAQPDPAVENSGCVELDTLWSCAVPKEDQASIAPNDPDQPNFRIEIRFRNGTLPANETTALPSSTASKRSTATRHEMLQQRQNDPFFNALFAPTPATPTSAEQIFLGNTTDNITFPFDGEATPFFITFVPTSPVLPSAFNTTSSRLRTRQTANSSNTITSDVPPPDIGTDGTAGPANLLPDDPLPYSQPVRLYNRGQSTEHYGFYTYFDKAIFVTNTTPVADGQTGPSEDQNGGSTKGQANWRCTFSQTRFLVRIWTNAGFGATLLNGGPTVFPDVDADNSTTTTTNSTATDFTPPGSFPYPISITLDRHGGNMNEKGAYCYKMDPSGDGKIVIDDTSPVVLAEIRGAGGVEVNAAPSKLNLPDGGNAGGTFDPNAGGIDGGTGGCSCEWRNWLGNMGGNV